MCIFRGDVYHSGGRTEGLRLHILVSMPDYPRSYITASLDDGAAGSAVWGEIHSDEAQAKLLATLRASKGEAMGALEVPAQLQPSKTRKEWRKLSISINKVRAVEGQQVVPAIELSGDEEGGDPSRPQRGWVRFEGMHGERRSWGDVNMREGLIRLRGDSESVGEMLSCHAVECCFLRQICTGEANAPCEFAHMVTLAKRFEEWSKTLHAFRGTSRASRAKVRRELRCGAPLPLLRVR